MLELTLLSYAGPGTVAGIPFKALQVSEHAEGEGARVVRRWWEVTAEAERRDVPMEMVRRAAVDGKCVVAIPDHGEAMAAVVNVSLVDGRRWVLEIRGEGRAPLTEHGR